MPKYFPSNVNINRNMFIFRKQKLERNGIVLNKFHSIIYISINSLDLQRTSLLTNLHECNNSIRYSWFKENIGMPSIFIMLPLTLYYFH